MYAKFRQTAILYVKWNVEPFLLTSFFFAFPRFKKKRLRNQDLKAIQARCGQLSFNILTFPDPIACVQKLQVSIFVKIRLTLSLSHLFNLLILLEAGVLGFVHKISI